MFNFYKKGMIRKFIKNSVLLLLIFVCATVNAQTQSFSVKIRLQDSKSGEPVGYAAVSLTKEGSKSVFKYVQTDDNGDAEFTAIPKGKYKVEAMLMGYDVYSEMITVDKNLDLGVKKMKVQANFLEGATVSALGNPIVVKKDTIEHNVALMKTSDNDVLEDLLKRLPGVEVDSDGKITANGKEITKIQIDGKQFFLDDPSLASKNLPAKIIEKVRVVEKKSEQAQFTGIDDGEEETVLDLGVKKGMMNGWFGNVMAGGGADLQSNPEARYQGAGMVARFNESSQLAFIGNANNTNNRGFNDLAANAMGGMMGGFRGGLGGGWGGWNGISTSYMGGFNGSYTWPNKSEITGNALANRNIREVKEQTDRTTTLNDGSKLHALDDSKSVRMTTGVRAGARADWKIGESTSILFEPNFNLGWGHNEEQSFFSTGKIIGTDPEKVVNKGKTDTFADSESQNANGRILWRQRLGKPGRTISVNARYQFSNTNLNGKNYSLTENYNDNQEPSDLKLIDQRYDRNSRNQGVNGRISYTEPLGNNFYAEVNYSANYRVNTSIKKTYDIDAAGNYTVLDEEYSNRTYSSTLSQNAGVNFRKQEGKFNATVGASYQPSSSKNQTWLGSEMGDPSAKPWRDIERTVHNWSPNARLDINFSDYEMLRLNYRGNTNQPSINQLMPVPDNSNPQRVTLGNINLVPSFNHSVWTMYRVTNMETYASFNINGSFNYTNKGIVNASWYDETGVQYTVPVNSTRGTRSANIFTMYNTPIAKSKFSVMLHFNANYSGGISFIGNSGIDSEDDSGMGKSYLNMDNYVVNNTHNFSAAPMIRFTFRSDIFEMSLGGRTRYHQSFYSDKSNNKPSDWTSNISTNIVLNSDWIGFKTDARYTFYNGYASENKENTFVWNAELSKQFYKKMFTVAVKCYDILGQSKNTYHTVADNYEQDTYNNTLGRYIMLSLTFRFGTFGGNRGGGMGGPGFGGPGFGGFRR